MRFFFTNNLPSSCVFWVARRVIITSNKHISGRNYKRRRVLLFSYIEIEPLSTFCAYTVRRRLHLFSVLNYKNKYDLCGLCVSSRVNKARRRLPLNMSSATSAGVAAGGEFFSSSSKTQSDGGDGGGVVVGEGGSNVDGHGGDCRCKPCEPLKILKLVERLSSTTNSIEMQIIINKYVSVKQKILEKKKTLYIFIVNLCNVHHLFFLAY